MSTIDRVPMRIPGALYWLIVASYSVLEPWGRVDTRDFSYMGAYRFWEYNAFIVFQLVSMMVLGVLLWKGAAGRKAFVWLTAISTMFVMMNMFDLLHFFPDPPQSLPFPVIAIEVIDSALALGVILLCSRSWRGHFGPVVAPTHAAP